jgi:hypothetical protein
MVVTRVLDRPQLRPENLGGASSPDVSTLYSIACVQTEDNPRAEPAGRHIRASLVLGR